jgi:hypothetical protein
MNNPRIIDNLKENICHEIAVIPADMLRVQASLVHFVQLCMDAKGDHFQLRM